MYTKHVYKTCIETNVYKTMYTKQYIQKMYTKHVFRTCIENIYTKQCIQNKSTLSNVYDTMYTIQCIQDNAYKTMYKIHIYKQLYTK